MDQAVAQLKQLRELAPGPKVGNSAVNDESAMASRYGPGVLASSRRTRERTHAYKSTAISASARRKSTVLQRQANTSLSRPTRAQERSATAGSPWHAARRGAAESVHQRTDHLHP